MYLKIILLLAVKFSEALVSNATWFYSDKPLVIGRAGSIGMYPPYTTAGYTDAFLSGADFIELTVQLTSDKVLMVNELPCLNSTTTTFS